MTIDIRAVQRRLISLGYDVGPWGADGVAGAVTRRAVAAFQADRGLAIQWPGTIGPKTLEALFGVSTEPKSVSLTAPWYAEATRRLGLHETRNRIELSEWLRSDGTTLGDPSKLPWCFTGETEILTEEGWQRLDALTASRVYQVSEGGEISPTTYIPVSKDYEGEVFDIDHRSLQLTCDVGHRWWGEWRAGEAPAFGTLDEMGSGGIRISHARRLSGGCGLSDEELVFLAAFMSDGSFHRGKCSFQVSRARKIAALMALGPSHCYVAKRAYGPLSHAPLTTLTFGIPDFFAVAFAEGKSLSTAFLHSFNAREAETFLRAYAIFDGNDNQSRIHLYTSSDSAKDALFTLAVFAGWNVSVGKKSSQLSTRECWEVRIGPNRGARRIQPKHISQREFSGKMYCVSVPQGRIIIRDPNGGAIVTGNCGDFVETAIGLTLPDEPLPANPYLARNWLRFGRPLDTPAVGAIAVFWRGAKSGTSGHVGFVRAVRPDGALLIRGGNQSDAVTDAWLASDRLLGLRWPTTFDLPTAPAPLVRSSDELSINEA